MGRSVPAKDPLGMAVLGLAEEPHLWLLVEGRYVDSQVSKIAGHGLVCVGYWPGTLCRMRDGWSTGSVNIPTFGHIILLSFHPLDRRPAAGNISLRILSHSNLV